MRIPGIPPGIPPVGAWDPACVHKSTKSVRGLSVHWQKLGQHFLLKMGKICTFWEKNGKNTKFSPEIFPWFFGKKCIFSPIIFSKCDFFLNISILFTDVEKNIHILRRLWENTDFFSKMIPCVFPVYTFFMPQNSVFYLLNRADSGVRMKLHFV